MEYDVIGLGALNMDSLYRVERVVEDSETVVDEVVSSPGGSAANTIYGLARLGLRTGFTGAVGADADGQMMVDELHKAGVDTSRIVVKFSTRSGAVLCLTDRTGKRSLYVMPGANNFLTPDDVDVDQLNRARYVHLSSFVHEEQFRLCLDVVGRLTARLSFSPGSLYVDRGADALAPVLKKTHVLFINGVELCQLTGYFVVRGAESCLKMGARIVVVTLGQGMPIGSRLAIAYVKDADGEYVIEPLPRKSLPIADTTGAGDAFAAGFLYGMITSRSLLACGRLGNTTARYCMTRMGARPGLPTREQLEESCREFYG